MQNLFGSKNEWFRFSKYQIIEKRGYYFIKPTANSEIIKYRPFDKFPDIIIDLMNTMRLINDIEGMETKYLFSLKGDQLGSNFFKNAKKRAEIFKNHFVKKYGLLGLFWNDIYGTKDNYPDQNKIYFNESPNSFAILSYYFTNNTNDPMEFLNSMAGISSPIDYNKYVSYFFPNINENYPDFFYDQKNFLKNYSESIDFIINDSQIQKIINHDNNLSKYKSNDLSEKEKYNIKNFRLDSLYSPQMILKEKVVDDYGNKEIKNWELSWNFDSLRNALGLMYILNMTRNIEGDQAKKCVWCEKYYPVGTSKDFRKSDSIYCESCKNSRKKINRAIMEIITYNKTIKEIALKHNKSEQTVKNWIKNYNPKNKKRKKLYDNYLKNKKILSGKNLQGS